MFSQFENAYELVLDKVNNWAEGLILMLPNVIVAIVVIILFYIISVFIRKGLAKLLDKISNNVAVNKLLISIANILVIILGVVVALNIMQLDKTVTSVLAGVSIVGLALGLAFQDAGANLISGVIMAVKSPIHVGDLIKTNNYFGTVKRIGLRSATIIVPTGQDVVVPNRLIMQNPYELYSIYKSRRIDLQCGISYGEDLEKVEKVTLQAVEKVKDMDPDKPIQFFYTEFGNSSINYVLRYWVMFRRQPDYLEGVHQGIKYIKKAYNENGITIPFPIRTLDFGIKGGEKLSEMLENGKK